MAIEKFNPISLEHLFEFIKNPLNDLDHMWIFKDYIYLGSILPKMTDPKINYTIEQLSMYVYIKSDHDLLQEHIIINSGDLSHYRFDYV